jgi:hypothetical protein
MANAAAAVVDWTERYAGGRASAIDLTDLLTASLGSCPTDLYESVLTAARHPDPTMALVQARHRVLLYFTQT